MTNCRMVGGVVTLWRMSWKHLKTFGTHLFLSKPDKPAVVRQAVSICLSLTHTHTKKHTHSHPLPVSSLGNSWKTKNIVRFCLLRRGCLCKPVERLQEILLFFSDCIRSSISHSATNKALSTEHAISTQTTKHIYHSHGESTQTVGLAICTRKRRPGEKNKISQKSQIIITTVQSSQEGKYRHMYCS